MTCDKCFAIIPENAVTCPACATKRNDIAMAAAQAAYLPKILNGQDDLRTVVIERWRHIRMFGAEITFCNLAVSRGHRRGYLPWDHLDKSDVCVQCRIRVRAVAKEVVPA